MPKKSQIYLICIIVLIALEIFGIQKSWGCNQSINSYPQLAYRLEADFYYKPKLPFLGQEIKFYNTSVGNPDECLWNFGDGHISQQINPTHRYYKNSIYFVTLRISKGDLISQLTKAILILNSSTLLFNTISEKLKADFIFEPDNPHVGAPVSFYDISMGSPSKRMWQFGYFDISFTVNPVRAFFSEGKHAVTLTIQKGKETDKITKYVNVNPIYNNTIIAKSCSLNDIEDAIRIAKPGDTIILPSGEARWARQLRINKGIVLKALNKGGTTIYADYRAPNNNGFDRASWLIVYEPSNPQDDPVFRLSGLKIISTGSTTSILCLRNDNVKYPLRKIRIDNNYFKTGTMADRRVLGIVGAVYGVADNNIFEDGSIISYGDNVASWENLVFDYGTEDNFYIEDNHINLTLGSVGAGAGGRYAFRQNTWKYKSNTGLYPWFDAHGNMGQDGNHATMGVEIYNETMFFDMPSGYGIGIFDIRGGKALVFNINVIFQNAGSSSAKVREEYYDYLNLPAKNSAGQPQYPSDCYFFLLRMNGSTQVNVEVTQQLYYEGKGYVPMEDKEFWQEKKSFNGSSGVGVGPISRRPTSCTKEGVGWWAIDENKLYRWENGKWEIYFKPYIYPHPMRNLLKD